MYTLFFLHEVLCQFRGLQRTCVFISGISNNCQTLDLTCFSEHLFQLTDQISHVSCRPDNNPYFILLNHHTFDKRNMLQFLQNHQINKSFLY